MNGIDISHWQNKIDWKKVKKAGYEFAFCKCTQGLKYKDPTYEKNKKEAREAGLLFGAYHFADANSAEIEAENFCKNVGDLKEGEIVILDYETHAIKDPASWCLRWLAFVEKELGFKPMLYTYHEFLKKYDWKKVSDNNNGLWAARYGLQQQKPNNLFKPATGSWQFYAIWQYCSKGKVDGITGNVDLNYTELRIETLKKYGKKAKKEKSDTKVPLSQENAPNDGITPVESIPQEVEVVANQPQEPIMLLKGSRTIISAILAFVVTMGAISQGEADQLTEGVLALLSVATLVSTIYFRVTAKK